MMHSRSYWRFTFAIPVLLSSLFCSITALAQLSRNMEDMLRRISSGEFGAGSTRRGAGAGGQWIDGGRAYTVTERNANGVPEIVRYDTATGQREVFLSAEQLTPPRLGKPLLLSEYAVAADGRRMLLAVNPRRTMVRKTAYDYWVFDRSEGSWRQLGGEVGSGRLYGKLSPDGSCVAYVQENNLYIEDIRSGMIRQLTSDGSSAIINGSSDWVYEEEFYLADGFQWSPDSQWIAYFQMDQSLVPEFALINYTDNLYPVITRYPYPKAGQTNAAVRVGIVSARGGPTRWVKAPGDPRNTYIPRMDWAANSQEVILQHLNRLQSINTFLLASAETGEVRPLFRDEDAAWVDINSTFVWLEKGRRLLLVSERDGWRHAYAISREGAARLITAESFDLISIAAVDEPGGWLYYIASPENATQRYLYRSRLDGSGQTARVTPAGMAGTHTYSISPDCRWAFHGHSSFATPGVWELISLPDHRTVRVLQDNAALKAKVAPLFNGRTELFQVDVGDGVKLDGWLIKPGSFDPARKYPLIVYVYGEPASTTVNDGWGGPGRILLTALADDGYLIASFDNRGTPAPKGRAWRKVIYGSVGVLASKEQAAAVRTLAASRSYVDLTRIGVYGWSGGGSMTLNLMFRSPELFKVGVAGAPVPDQTLYDSIYQERYMGLPQDNAEGYRAGSPISYAEGLQGKLLIIHGTGDDNVHFQGTQRLLNRLIDLNKQFSFMEYPNRSHGISGIHLDTLRFGFLEQYLPAGGR